MSINLLQNPIHHHDIEDDRESAFYVLLWICLAFTKYSDSRGTSGWTGADLKRAFIEARPDDVSGVMRGGTLKSCFLRGKSRLCFDGRPPLNALVDELCGEFGVRYGHTPHSGNAERLAQLLACYNNSRKNLRTENWLVNTLQKYLNPDGWPSDDKAEDQDPVVQVSLGHKRPRDQQDLNERPSKKARNAPC